MKIIERDGYQYIQLNKGKAEIIFFTSKGNLSFNIREEEGRKNISRIREWFNLSDIGYMSQVHSDIVRVYDGKVQEGDAIITDEMNTGLGIFTADCVPVLLYDSEKNIIGAVHSGWKGTFSEITKITIERMRSDYNCKPENISVFVGPHIRECCYEVSRELLEKFYQKYNLNNHVTDENKLSLEYFVRLQCSHCGIPANNIFTYGACTYCSKEPQFHSYRKDNGTNGRMLSMIFLKE